MNQALFKIFSDKHWVYTSKCGQHYDISNDLQLTRTTKFCHATDKKDSFTFKACLKIFYLPNNSLI